MNCVGCTELPTEFQIQPINGDDFYVFSLRHALRHKVPPAAPLPVGKAALSVKTTGVGRAGPFLLYIHRVHEQLCRAFVPTKWRLNNMKGGQRGLWPLNRACRYYDPRHASSRDPSRRERASNRGHRATDGASRSRKPPRQQGRRAKHKQTRSFSNAAGDFYHEMCMKLGHIYDEFVGLGRFIVFVLL